MSDVLLRPLVRLQIALTELKEREDGQTTTEYAILLGFLAIAIIVALFFLRNVLREPVLRCGRERLGRTDLLGTTSTHSSAGPRMARGPALLFPKPKV